MSQPGTALALLANRLQVSETEVKQSLTQTVFKGASDAQMTALLVVANEYRLNPFVKELYAFPSQNGIVPMVSIDGWLRIINEHPQFAGMDIRYADEIVKVEKSKPCPEYIEVTILRKDRPHASTPIREYLDECYRNTQPWNTMTRRMLRHKAIKEAGRVTMGLHGIYDEDEARDLLAREGKTIIKTGEAYEVIEAEPVDDGQVIDESQLVALLDEMRRTGLSDDAVHKNLEMKANYSGPLEDMPLRIYEPLMAGLAKMPTKEPPEPDNGSKPETASSAAEEPEKEASAEASYWPKDEDEPENVPGMDAAAARAHWDQQGSELISTPQMRQLMVNWKKLEGFGCTEAQLREQMALLTGGKTSRKTLTLEEASRVIKSFAAEAKELEKRGEAA